MKWLFIILLMSGICSCTTDVVEPEDKLNITGYWQNAKDEILDDVKYPFYPVVLNVLQDANGYVTLVGEMAYDKAQSFPLSISGNGVVNTADKSFSFTFQTEEMLWNGIPTKLTGQIKGNIVGDMLRGHLNLNAMYLYFVVHLKRTPPIIYLPKLSPHNQGAINQGY